MKTKYRPNKMMITYVGYLNPETEFECEAEILGIENAIAELGKRKSMIANQKKWIGVQFENDFERPKEQPQFDTKPEDRKQTDKELSKKRIEAKKRGRPAKK